MGLVQVVQGVYIGFLEFSALAVVSLASSAGFMSLFLLSLHFSSGFKQLAEA